MSAPLTALGVAHTLFSLVAIGSAVVCLGRQGTISPDSRIGRIYIGATALTAASALGIFRHGGFGAAHALAVLTLTALAFGLLVYRMALFGTFNLAVRTATFSATLLFHAIPGVTEALTRLPLDSPVFASAEAPQFRAIYGLLFLLYVVGLVFQLRSLRRRGGG